MDEHTWFWWQFVPEALFFAVALIFRKRLGVTWAKLEDFPLYRWLEKGVKDL